MKRLLIILIIPLFISATNFEELEKAPEGAHVNQLFIGGFLSIGYAGGTIIDAESSFLKDTTYTFEDSGTIKYLETTHLSFTLGASVEYMPIDYIGLKSRLQYTNIIQRSKFGSEYSNSRGDIYRDVSLLFGPSFHLTKRKPWDIVLTPIFGLSYARFEALPVAKKRLSGFNPSTSKVYLTYTYGAELNGTIYFSGGLYVSAGVQYLYHPISFDSFSDTNPQTGAGYNGGKGSGDIYTMDFVISAGYAYYN